MSLPSGERLSRRAVEALVEARSGAGDPARDADLTSLYRESCLHFLRLLADERAGSRSPHDTLAATYQQLLCYTPHRDLRTGSIRLRRTDRVRKDTGAFYTPRPIARLAVRAALAPLTGARFPRVLDPAMGTGAFLIETIHYLTERWERETPPPPPDIQALLAERCLYGSDTDPIAVELAILAISLETGARPAILRRHLRCGNLLFRPDPALPESYDAVIGNPPWGASYSRQEREELMRLFPRSTRGSFDSFKLFLELACRLTQGTVGMIVPQAILAQTSHADVRDVLLGRLDPYVAAKLDAHAFPGAAAPACILVFGPKPGPREVEIVDHTTGSSHHRVPSTYWRSQQGFPLDGSAALGLLERLQDRHPTIGRLDHLYRVRDTGINYNRASVAERILYTGSGPHHPLDIARYRGRDFARYTAIRPGGWIRHHPQRLLQTGETLSIDHATRLLPAKIVVRQTADRIVATLDRGNMAMGRSVIAIIAETDVSLPALLACLNSRLMTLLYRSLAGEDGRLLPQVKVSRLRALPVPDVCSLPKSRTEALQHTPTYPLSGMDSREILGQTATDPLRAWAWLEQLANARLECKRDEDAHLDDLIDHIVYRLYGLTEDEIRLVEES